MKKSLYLCTVLLLCTSNLFASASSNLKLEEIEEEIIMVDHSCDIKGMICDTFECCTDITKSIWNYVNRIYAAPYNDGYGLFNLFNNNNQHEE